MISLIHDNILVKEVVKDSKAGVLTISQDSSSAYMFVKILHIADEAYNEISQVFDEGHLDINKHLLVIRRSAKDPFVKNSFFISSKDVRGVIDEEFLENI